MSQAPTVAIGARERWAFGVGQLAEGVKSGAFSFFLLFYYNQVLGLSGVAASTALTVAVVFDAISDPLVGSLSDAHRGRLGRRHPFMYGAALPFAACFYALMDPPDALGEGALFAWLLVFAVLTRTAMTFYSVPHLSLGAELTDDYHERTRLSSLRALFGVLGSVGAVAGGFAFFFVSSEAYPNGQLDPAAYPPFAVACAVAMVLSIWASALGTHRAIPLLPQGVENPEPLRMARVFREYGDALRLRAFRFLFTSLVSNYAVQGVAHTLSLYVLTYFWRVSSAQVPLLMAAGLGGIAVGALIAGRVSLWSGGKRQAGIGALVWYASFGALMVTLRLLGLAPPDGHPALVPLICLGGFLGGVGNGVMSTVGYSMLADVTDEHERSFGARQEGIYYGSMTFAVKAASGIGVALSGVAIDAVGLTPQSDPADVAASVITGLGIFYGQMMFVCMLLPALPLWFYPIDARRHAETQALLAERRG